MSKDEKTDEILKNIDAHRDRIFEEDDNYSLSSQDQIQTRVRCIEDNEFQLHVLIYNSMPNLYYIYVRILSSIELFAIAEPKAVLSLEQSTEELEKSLLYTINCECPSANNSIASSMINKVH